MKERISPAGGTPQDFFQDERFSHFRRIRVSLEKSILEIPDPDAVEEEGRQRASELEGKKAKRYKEGYVRAAASLRNTIASLRSATFDDDRFFERINDARRAYSLAALHLSDAEAMLGKKIDKKV